MQKFSDFLISESINTPQEYFLTADTVMPSAIYAKFDVDGKPYIMSLVETESVGVYMLKVGRTSANGGKVMWWQYHAPNHIAPVLSTMLNFAQASVSFVPTLKGISVEFLATASGDMNRLQKFAERIVKKSYVKSFSLVPVSQPPITDKDKYAYHKTRYLFVAKKGASLTSLFSGKTFKKYNFNGKEAPIEGLASLKPKKAQKTTHSILPSPKYSFGQFDVEVPAEGDIVGKIEKIKTEIKSGKAQAEPAAQKADPIEKLKSNTFTGSKRAGVLLALSNFSGMVSKLQKYGFDEDKLNWGDLEFQMNQTTPQGKKALEAAGMGTPNNPTDKMIWTNALKAIAKGTTSETIKKETEEVLKVQPKLSSVSQTPIDINELQATMPGSGTGEISIKNNSWVVPNYSQSSVSNHIYENLEYSDIKNLPNFNQAYSYSGSAYSTFNNPLRKVVGDLLAGNKLSSAEINKVAKSTSKIYKLSKMFDKVKPLPESLWVYRGTLIPKNEKNKIEIGYQYVDPAFMSTSTKADISFGYDKMRIFIPKGSKVLPLLWNSKHWTEHEILLPPASVIEVLDVQLVNDRHFIQGVFVGSPFKSMLDALKKQLTMAEGYDRVALSSVIERLQMNEAKEDKYDAEGKFGGEYDADLADLIMKQIASGKFKFDETKKEKK